MADTRTTTNKETEKGQEPPAKKAKAEEEAPDEWTVLAQTYTDALVPAFAPIYQAVANLLKDEAPKGMLDFGCGPGEPALTLLDKVPSLTIAVGVDSTKSMLEIAQKRAKDNDKITFTHVRRDVTMADFKEVVGKQEAKLDVVVSTFVLHYVEFPRRVELLTTFLELAPRVLLATWGKQSRVGFLRAIKTFGSWKGKPDRDICAVKIEEEDDGKPESGRGSFTMPSKDKFQAIVDQVPDSKLVSFETRPTPLRFSSVKALLSFLPMPTDDKDCEAMWKLLQSWSKEEVELSDSLDKELCFPSDVAFCSISRKDA